MDLRDQNGASINTWDLDEKYNCSSFVDVGISLSILLKLFFVVVVLFLLYEKVTVALQMIVFFLTCTERTWDSSKDVEPKLWRFES